MPLYVIADALPRAAAASVCEIVAHKRAYLNKEIQIEGTLVNASPHGIYLTDTKRPGRCILDIGDQADGQDILALFFGARPSMEVRAQIAGVVRSEVRTNMYGQPYRSYFLDKMVISRTPAAP